MHFTFVGGSRAFFDYPSAEVIEIAKAIVVLPAKRYIGPSGPGWLSSVGFGRTVTVILARPLGERVIVDFDSSPVAVAPAEPA